MQRGGVCWEEGDEDHGRMKMEKTEKEVEGLRQRGYGSGGGDRGGRAGQGQLEKTYPHRRPQKWDLSLQKKKKKKIREDLEYLEREMR